jgi:hypothetical protein
MQQVWPGVSGVLIDRTRKWLLSRREGNGNFKQNRGKYGFSAASREVNNAYVVYALSEAGVTEMGKEYEHAYSEAMRSRDAYRMAVVAIASFNLKQNERGGALLDELLRQMNGKGTNGLKADHSIVISYGKSLQVETASLTALALLRSPRPDAAALQKLMEFIISSRSHGGFGSTQATILALKAVTGYARYNKRAAEDGKIELYLNNRLVAAKEYHRGTRGEITLPALEGYMQPGDQQFRVVFAGTREPLPYSLNASWSAYTPSSSPECKVDLETSLAASSVSVGKTLRLTTVLKNKTPQGQPMTVALVGIPSGLSPQPWQLKELQERGVFDFYEVRKNYLVFYYRELGPKAIHTISLDLKAEVPGVYEAPAGTAYLYYTGEYRDWEGGERVEVRK